MCLRIESRSPPTRKFPEEGSEMDNREIDNELSKPTENPDCLAATNVSTVERYTAVIENREEMGTSIGLPERPEVREKK